MLADFDWAKPTVGGSSGTWGTELNTILDVIQAHPGIKVLADAAAKTAYVPLLGQVVLQADTGKIYKCTNAIGPVWAEVSPAAIADTVLTAKGDLLVYGSVLTRLGVGADGQVLTADAAQTLGVKWAAASGGGGGLDANGVMEFPLDTPPNNPVSGSVLVFADYLPSETNSIPQMTANDAPSGACSGSEKHSNTEYWHAFENTGAHNGWITNGSALPQYIQYQFASAKTIVAYSMRAWYYDNYPSRTPKNWTFQGSVDGSNWDSLDTRVDYTPTSASVYKLFVCKFRGSYSYYRLYITANNGNAYTGIGGLKMFEAGTVVGLAIRQSDGSYLLMGY